LIFHDARLFQTIGTLPTLEQVVERIGGHGRKSMWFSKVVDILCKMFSFGGFSDWGSSSPVLKSRLKRRSFKPSLVTRQTP
jgi:hypothetical protein